MRGVPVIVKDTHGGLTLTNVGDTHVNVTPAAEVEYGKETRTTRETARLKKIHTKLFAVIHTYGITTSLSQLTAHEDFTHGPLSNRQRPCPHTSKT